VPRRTSTLALRDRLMLAIGLPVWAIFWTLSARCVLLGTPYPAIAVGPTAPDAYPVVSGFYPWLPGEASGLRVGDRVVRLGGADMRGVGPMGLVMLVPERARGATSVAVVYERAGERRESALPLGSLTALWPSLPGSLLFVLTGSLLLVRARPATRLVRAIAAMMLVSGIFLGTNALEPRAAVYPQLLVRVLAETLLGPLAVWSMLEFRGDGPVGALERFGPWVLGVGGPIELFGRLSGTAETEAIGMALSLVIATTMLVIGTRIYRQADPVARRQARWVMYGFYCALAPSIAIFLMATVEPKLLPLAFPARLFGALVPISILIAVARYDLFDIDRLITATASYNVVLVLLVAAGLVLAPRVAAAAATSFGVDPWLGQTAVALALAGVVVPAHRRIRPRLERMFFPERWAVDRGVETLLRDLSHAGGLDALLTRGGEGLDRLLRPESCVVFARDGTTFAPVFARGRAIPPAFGAGSPLIAALRLRDGLLALEGASDGPRRHDLDPFDHAALETLEAAVVLPLGSGDGLVAFLCLGRKRSGDVYTPTDLRLLAMVADKLSSELLRIEQAEVLRESRRMQAELRRYVPGAVAERLASGDALDAGEREVTVLFVDLRSYTTYAETRRASELFSTVNRYTEAVSRVVLDHGGSIVEFAGDGMMAVFGAPVTVADKERAAVAASRAICAAVGELPSSGFDAAFPRLAVGIGVATGPAFVGNVQAVDRAIWTAIGDTVNLAARLQALTREVGAAIVIDAPTWWRLEADVRACFARHEAVNIRGRRKQEDLYVVPLPKSPTGEAPDPEAHRAPELRLVTGEAAITGKR
jgi:class 3 adenylate cyclase